ncbi:MAG TPA: SRPBCC family protein [Thermoleophilaceae bacterium]|nr:SRPBCC family protein [Thermoleophilaceae bacterium]
MQTVSTTREIVASLESVWGIVKDPSRYGDWNVTHTAFPDGTPDFYAEGMTIRERLVIMGMPAEARWTITHYEDLRGVAMEGDGPMGITLRQILGLTESRAGTIAEVTTSIDGSRLLKPIVDSLAQAARKAAGESLEQLTALAGGHQRRRQ